MFDMPKYCKKNKKSVPVDKELYNRVKAQVKRKKTLKWPSFYASNHLSKLYRKKGGKYRCAFGNAINLQNVQFRNTNPPHHNRVTYRMDFENKWENRNLWEEEDISRQYNNQFTPETVLREAFEKFIVNTPIESNTVGIQIIYLEDENSMQTKTMFIGKRTYSGTTEQFRINDIPDVSPYDDPRSTRTYVQSFEENGNNFRNDQLEELLEQLSNYFILMITLCEVYNDDPEFRTRRSRRRRRGRPLPENIPSGYYPFTIPILLLYKNVPARFLVPPPQREITDTRAINTQQQLMQNLENPSAEAQEALLNNEMFRTDIPTMGNETENPRQLKIVKNQELLDKPMTSYIWEGQCMICLDNTREGLCRVNCSAGHVFHCDCVNMWRNSRLTNSYFNYGWHNDCPVCHEPIKNMVEVPPDYAARLPTEFGKKRSVSRTSTKLKKLNKEIKFLSSKK